MPSRRLNRYIAYNVALWMAIACSGLLMLVLVREYGNGLTRRRLAAEMIQEAAGALKEGALYDAQSKACAAMDAYPPITQNVIAAMGRSLAGLPLIRDKAGAIQKEKNIDVGPEADTILTLTTTPPPALSPADFPGGADAPGDINLWAGRSAFYAGDITLARERFQQYWQNRPETHESLRQTLWPSNVHSGTDLYAAGKRLLYNGLLPEAFQAFSLARQAGYETPDLLVMQGVQAELAQKPEEARKAYETALQALPTHRLALLRLSGLSPTPTTP